MPLKKEFTDKIANLKEYIALATVDAKNYQEINLEIIKYLTSKKISGVYVTLNKPFKILQSTFKSKGIDARLVIFIDAVTKTSGGKIEKSKDCLYIGSPENLSDISIAMDQAVRAVPGKEKFLFFDSLSTLLLYNNVQTVARFVHFLASKMRVWKVKGVIISLKKKSDKELINEFSQFCDIIVDLG